MRAYRCMNQRIAFPMIQKLLCVGERVGEIFVIGGREANDRLRQDPPHACGLGFARNVVFEIIHVRISGNTTVHHLQVGEARSPGDKVRSDVTSLSGDDVIVQPVMQ